MDRNKNLDGDGVERGRAFRSQKWGAQGQPSESQHKRLCCIGYTFVMPGAFKYFILSFSQFNLDVEVKEIKWLS